MRRAFLLLLPACGGGAETQPPPVNVPVPTVVDAGAVLVEAAAPAVSFDDCKSKIAKRFNPPASWSEPWTKGPSDRTPYSDCKNVWIDGQPPPTKPIAQDACFDSRGAWAGISMTMSQLDWGISDDGMTMMRCHSDCTAFNVTDGHVLDKTKGPDGIDGTPIRELPRVKAMIKKYGLTHGESKLPIDDVKIEWSFAPKGAAITWHLLDRKSVTEVILGRFAHADKYPFPYPWAISKNGRALVLLSETRLQGQGIDQEDSVVDFPAALALLYVEAASRDPALADRARTQCQNL
jgi:hypothetical protein